MLREIRISNLAIVPESQVAFDGDLNVLTGETGAGKSILLEAVSLLAGKRAQSQDVRAGTDQAVIEGVVEFSEASAVWAWLESSGFTCDKPELLIKRIVAADGRSRAYLNDANATIATLSQLSTFWLDMTGQHAQHKLLEKSSHTNILDEYAHATDAKKSYDEDFQHIRTLDRRIQQINDERKKVLEEKEYYEFRLKELEDADLKLGEEESLKAQYDRSAHQGKLVHSVSMLEDYFDDEAGLLTNLGKIQAELRGMIKYDPTWQGALDQISDMSAALGDLHHKIVDYRGKLDVHPEAIEAMNMRLAELQKISRKFGSVDKAIEERDRIRRVLSENDEKNLDETRLHKERDVLARALLGKGMELSSIRKKGAKKLSDEITAELRNLGMGTAKLEVKLVPVPPNADALSLGDHQASVFGLEQAEFYFSANSGEVSRPLEFVASGGELSRILLAVKSIGFRSQNHSDYTYIFDEVDAGIGGDVAERVGRHLKNLARGRQVLCVTHLAQVACYAGTHLKVEKNLSKGRTISSVKKLSTEERKRELARMIGGIEITQKTQDHANELFIRASGEKTSSLTS